MLKRLPNGNYVCCKWGSRGRYYYLGANKLKWGASQLNRDHVDHTENEFRKNSLKNEEFKRFDVDATVNWLSGSITCPTCQMNGRRSVSKELSDLNKGRKMRYEIPVVNDQVYKMIWERDFQSGNVDIVPQVIKRLIYNRNIFTIEQLTPLIKKLYSRQDYYDIHQIYSQYKYIWNYSISCKSILDILINVEYAMCQFTECEKLLANYLQGNDNISPDIILIGLQTFINNNNLPMCKEFYIQIINNVDIFPITTDHFNKFISFLHGNKLLPQADFFFAKWCQKDKPLTAELLMNVAGNYLQLNDLTIWNKFLNLAAIKRLKFVDSAEFKVIKFTHDCFQRESLNGEKYAELLEYMENDKINGNQYLIDFFLYKMSEFEINQNRNGVVNKMINLQENLKKIKNDKMKDELVVEQFIRHGNLIDLMKFYREKLYPCANGEAGINKYNNIWDENELVFKIICCFNAKYEVRDTKKLVERIKSMIEKNVKYKRVLPNLIETGLGRYSSIHNERLNKFKNLIENSQVSTMNSLFNPAEKMLEINTVFLMLRLAITNNLNSVAQSIDTYIREKTYNQPRYIRKLDFIWITHKIKMFNTNRLLMRQTSLDNNRLVIKDAFGRSNDAYVISHNKFKIHGQDQMDKDTCKQLLYSYINTYSLRLRSWEWRQISEQYIILEDFTMSMKCLQMALIKIKEQELVPATSNGYLVAKLYSAYYMTLLKHYTRSKQVELFMETLNTWVRHEAVSWSHVMKLTIVKYGKYFISRGCLAEDQVAAFQQNLSCVLQKLTSQSQTMRDTARQEQDQVVHCIEQWLQHATHYNDTV